MKLDGVGPDTPTIVNAAGGAQSASPYRFDLLPPFGVAEVAKTLKAGAEKYAPWNWRRIHPEDHLNHALQHAMAWIAGDEQEGTSLEHARHFACRALMFLDTLVLQGERVEPSGELPPALPAPPAVAIPPDVPAPEDVPEEILSLLTPRQRCALVLRRKGLSFPRIAREMAVTVGTAWDHVRAAEARLFKVAGYDDQVPN